mgnify:FL=1
MKSKIKYYLNILFCLTILSCSKDSGGGSTDMTTTVVDPKDTWGNWSEWTPAFSDQTASFTQTRERSVTVNGQEDSNPPSGDASQSREITVTSSTQTVEDNERSASFNLDLNEDGDWVDYVSRELTTYTASNGLGSFSVYTSDWVISFDQDADFFTNNYGKWAAGIYDSSGVFQYYYAVDVYDRAEDTDILYAGENDDCFTPQNLLDYLNEIPWEVFTLQSNTITKLAFNMSNIDASYWYGAANEGILLDFQVIYTTDNVAGNEIIEVVEATYYAGTIDLVDILTGEIGRVESLTVCNSGKSGKYKSLNDNKDRFSTGKEKLKKFRELNK